MQTLTRSFVVRREPGELDAVREEQSACLRFVELERAGGGVNGKAQFARRHIGFAETLVRARQFGLQGKRSLEMGDRFAGVVLRHEYGAECGVRFGMVRVYRQDAHVRRNRCVTATLLRQHVGEIEVCRGQIWRARNRALVAGDSVGRSVLLAAHIAEIEMRQRIVAAKRDGALQMRCHVIGAVERTPRQRGVVVIFGNLVVDLDRLVEQLHRRRRCVAALERDETEIVQAVGVVRHERKNVPVLPLGFDQCAGLMMGDGGIEQGRGRICAGWSKTSPLLAAHDLVGGFAGVPGAWRKA
jgi:hypothetical protein